MLFAVQASSAPATRPLSDVQYANVLVDKGLSHERAGRHDAALRDFTAALSLHVFDKSETARALYDRGVTFDELGRTKDAIEDYSSALLLAPDLGAALNNRANAFRRLGRLSEAKRDYRAALADGGALEYPNYGLGAVAEAEGNLAEAHAFYEAATRANPAYALARERLARLNAPVPAVPAVTPASLQVPDVDAPAAAIVLRPPVKAPSLMLAPASYGPVSTRLDLRPAIEDGRTRASGQIVQLGAWRDVASAAAGWNAVQARAEGALSGLTPQIVMVDLPGRGRYFRLRTDPGTGQTAAALCDVLHERGVACMVVRAG